MSTKSNKKIYSAATLVTQTRVKQNSQEQFARWLTKIHTTLAQFPGYIAHTIIPPHSPYQEDWVIMQQFESTKAAQSWLDSAEHKKLVDERAPLVIGQDTIYISHDTVPIKNYRVSAVISNLVQPEHTKEFLHWQSEIEKAQAKFPGFLHFSLLKPHAGINNIWVAIVDFDTEEHLHTWLTSEIRQQLLEQAKEFSLEFHVRKVHSGFNFWFSKPGQAKKSIWKENMLVLLGLYPTVFLYNYFINPLIKDSLPYFASLFIGNAASTIILAVFAIPVNIALFSWWLKPNTSRSTTIIGTLLVLLLYSLLLVIFSKL